MRHASTDALRHPNAVPRRVVCHVGAIDAVLDYCILHGVRFHRYSNMGSYNACVVGRVPSVGQSSPQDRAARGGRSGGSAGGRGGMASSDATLARRRVVSSSTLESGTARCGLLGIVLRMPPLRRLLANCCSSV